MPVEIRPETFSMVQFDAAEIRTIVEFPVTPATALAATFLAYPTDYDRPRGLRRDFDLTVGRYTRIGLRTPNPVRDPTSWRTIASQELPGDSGRRTTAPRSIPRVRFW